MHSRVRIKVLVKIAVLIVLTDGIGAVEVDSPASSTVSSGVNVTTSTKLPKLTSSTEAPVVTETLPKESTTEQATTVRAEEISLSPVTSSTSLAPEVGATGPNPLPNCSNFEISQHQPIYDKDSHIKKCCPFGEIFEQLGSGRLRCTPGEHKLDIETIYAVFYGDAECIEDKDNKLHFSYEPSNVCFANNLTFQYSKDQGDEMFVIQNGSLLVIAEGQFMAVFDQYCVEVDVSGKLLAKACDEVEPIVLKSTAVLIYVGMGIASIGLLLTCVAYAFVPKLNDVFGYLLVVHSGSFLCGMILISLAVCEDRCVQRSDVFQIFGHVFLITSVFAFLMMNVHSYVHAAYYLPNGLDFDTKNKRDVFMFITVLYTITIIPQFLPWRNSLIFHLILYIYYFAIAMVLCLCHRAIQLLADSKFIRFTVSQQNYNELTYTEAVNAQPRVDGERLKDVQSINYLCTVEAIFTFICWILMSSMTHNLDSHYDVFRIGAAYAVIFQGMLIGVLFVGGRKKWIIIRECWSYSGSIDLHAMEMEREMRTLERKPVIDS